MGGPPRRLGRINSPVAPTELSKYRLDRSYPRQARHGPHDAARFAGSGMCLILILTPIGAGGEGVPGTGENPP